MAEPAALTFTAHCGPGTWQAEVDDVVLAHFDGERVAVERGLGCDGFHDALEVLVIVAVVGIGWAMVTTADG